MFHVDFRHWFDHFPIKFSKYAQGFFHPTEDVTCALPNVLVQVKFLSHAARFEEDERRFTRRLTIAPGAVPMVLSTLLLVVSAGLG